MKGLIKKRLPDKENFYRQLYETGITDKEYAWNTIWKHVNILLDLYLMTDVYLLIDVCENFRDMLNYYGLCRSTILVNAFLYITGVKDDRKG